MIFLAFASEAARLGGVERRDRVARHALDQRLTAYESTLQLRGSGADLIGIDAASWVEGADMYTRLETGRAHLRPGQAREGSEGIFPRCEDDHTYVALTTCSATTNHYTHITHTQP